MLSLEEIVKRSAELRAQHATLHAEREKYLLSEKPNDNKLSDLRKKLNETRDAIEDVETLRRDAEKREAGKRREATAAETQQRIEAATQSLAGVDAAATALQAAVEHLPTAYAGFNAAVAAARQALRTAGIAANISDNIAPSVDLMVAVELGRAGIGHLAYVRLTGIRHEPTIPAGMKARTEKVRKLIAPKAEPKTEAAA